VEVRHLLPGRSADLLDQSEDPSYAQAEGRGSCSRSGTAKCGATNVSGESWCWRNGHGRTSNTDSISTGMFNGSSASPTALWAALSPAALGAAIRLLESGGAPADRGAHGEAAGTGA
jgi:hypothetical protein